MPVNDVVAVAERKYKDRGETSANGGFSRRVEVFASKDCQPRQKEADDDESRECMRKMRGFGVQIRDIQRKLANERLGQHLRVFDVSDKRNREINGHATSMVSFAGVASRAAVFLEGKHIHIDQVVRQMLGQRILRLFLVMAVLS